ALAVHGVDLARVGLAADPVELAPVAGAELEPLARVGQDGQGLDGARVGGGDCDRHGSLTPPVTRPRSSCALGRGSFYSPILPKFGGLVNTFCHVIAKLGRRWYNGGRTGREADVTLLTISQAAAMIGVNPKTLRSWADKGLVPVTRLPSGYRRFSLEQVEEI